MILNRYDKSYIRRFHDIRSHEDTKQVSQWKKDIKEQHPDISGKEAARIAEKWLIEWRGYKV